MTIPTSNSANFMLLYNEKSPHAAPSACCPPRGSFCLGAARRQKSPHAAPSARCPQGGAFTLGRPGGKKRSRAPLYHLCQNLQPPAKNGSKQQQNVHIKDQLGHACASRINLWHKEGFPITNYLNARFVQDYAHQGYDNTRFIFAICKPDSGHPSHRAGIST